MRRVMIYPFDKFSVPLVKHIDLSEKNEVHSLISLKGWSRGESYLSAGKRIEVAEDFELALKEVDMVCFVESWIDISFEKYIFPQVKKALDEGKTAFITRAISLNERHALENLPHMDGQLIFPNSPQPSFAHFLEIETPIIAIGGYGQGMDKMETQLTITKELRKRGYSTLLIASNPAVSLLGEKFIPHFMYDSSLSGNEKVQALNYYIGNLEANEKPDIIVLGIPGAVITNDPDNFSDFGITAFEIGQAVPIDDLIMLSPCWMYPDEHFARIEEMVLGRIDTSILAHALSKNTYDFSSLNEMTYKTLLTVDERFVSETIRNTCFPNLLNIYSHEDIQKICNSILEKYGRYAEIGRYS
ncbi:TIGR04066 family peptide maturation system protein [Oscillospiraceae bacterium 21-37]